MTDRRRSPHLPPVPLLILAVALIFWSAEVADPDLGWHLFGGAWIATHRSLPAFDPINSFNGSWIDYHWLGQLLFYEIYQFTGGFVALKVFIACIALIILTGVSSIITVCTGVRRLHLLHVVLLLGSAYLIYDVTSVRPQMIAIAILVWATRLLLRPPELTELPMLLALTVVLTNIHVYWVCIPLLWFCYRSLPRLVGYSPLSSIYAWGGLLCLGLAGFASPYGALNYYVIWDYLQTPTVLVDTISEFRSALSRPGIVPLLIILAFAGIVRTFRWRLARRDPGSLLGAALGLLLPVYRVKFLPIMVIFCLPLISRLLAVRVRQLRTPLLCYDARAAKLIGHLCALAALLFAWQRNPWSTSTTALLDKLQPRQACSLLATYLAKAPPPPEHHRILTHFNHGGWCRWAIYDKDPLIDARVTTDGRTQNVPAEHYKLSFDLFGAKEGWNITLGLWNPDAIVASRSSSLANVLPFDARWKIAHQDDNFVLFLPTQPHSKE